SPPCPSSALLSLQRPAPSRQLHSFPTRRSSDLRKARRIYDLASRFGLPILTFIDTPGAYPGLGAEERGQSEAIGACLASMTRARSEEHTSELQSHLNLVCRLLLEKKKNTTHTEY